MTDTDSTAFQSSVLSEARQSQCEGLDGVTINFVDIISQRMDVDGTHLVIQLATHCTFNTELPNLSKEERVEDVAACLENSYSHLEIVEQDIGPAAERDESTKSRKLYIILWSVTGSLVLAVLTLLTVFVRWRRQVPEVDKRINSLRVDNGRDNDNSRIVDIGCDEISAEDIQEMSDRITHYVSNQHDPEWGDHALLFSSASTMDLDILFPSSDQIEVEEQQKNNVHEFGNESSKAHRIIPIDSLPPDTLSPASSQHERYHVTSIDESRCVNDGHKTIKREEPMQLTVEGESRIRENAPFPVTKRGTRSTEKPTMSNDSPFPVTRTFDKNGNIIFLSEDTSTSLRPDIFIERFSGSKAGNVASHLNNNNRSINETREVTESKSPLVWEDEHLTHSSSEDDLSLISTDIAFKVVATESAISSISGSEYTAEMSNVSRAKPCTISYLPYPKTDMDDDESEHMHGFLNLVGCK